VGDHKTRRITQILALKCVDVIGPIYNEVNN